VMTAAQLTRALGGRWHGRYGTARCLVHDDRSPSLSIVDGKEGPVVTCFAGCDWREVRAELRRRGFVDDGIRLHQRAPDRNFDRYNDTKSPKPAEGRVGITDTEDTTRALAIWAEAKQLGDIALKYCISRGISELSLPNIDGVLRFHPHCPFGRSERHPCIVACGRMRLRTRRKRSTAPRSRLTAKNSAACHWARPPAAYFGCGLTS
jgi:putative DNA primase/helicase